MLSTVMFLDWLAVQHNDPKVSEVGRIIENALFSSIAEGVKTKDLGGTASTTEFTQGIIERLARFI
jgi:3-isopropylmalate dehydrogenase